MDYQKVLAEIAAELQGIENIGKVAAYIPELGKVDPDKFGMHLLTTDHRHYSVGDSEERFSIQSIAKVMMLTLAFELEDEKLWERVGVEPSGTNFNSLVQLEYENGIPRNPFLNAGALVLCDILISRLSNPKQQLLDYMRKAAGNPDINYCPRIAESERLTGFRNTALVNFMKSFGNIKNEVEVVLDFYFNLCSIELSCRELTQLCLFLAADGVNPANSERIISSRKSKRINSIMQLCGFYDEAGEFAFRVGLPGKSGVGGGIIAVLPGEYSVAVWSPKLNQKGNSYKGMRALELLTTKTKSSIF